MPNPRESEAARSLRILVCPHELVTGGSQINAIDLASRLKDRGHEVEIYARPGELTERIVAAGISFVPAPGRAGTRVAPLSRSALAREIRRFRPDIVHTYEAPPAVASALVAATLPHHSVTTVMSMSVPDHIPEDIPLFVGTAELVAGQAHRVGPVQLMEPPIDTVADAPGNTAEARRELNIDDDQFVVAVVGRLSEEHHKAAGIREVIEQLASTDLPRPVTLIVAGTGDRAAEVAHAAASAADHPRLTIRLEGNVPDPRVIYRAADVVFGMGGSALRGMSHGKPLIVQGREGFWRVLTADTVEQFLEQGFFGSGPSGGPGIASVILDLERDPALRDQMGRFGRELILQRFSLERATSMLEAAYARELDRDVRLRSRWSYLIQTYLRYGKYRLAIGAPWLQRAVRQVSGRP